MAKESARQLLQNARSLVVGLTTKPQEFNDPGRFKEEVDQAIRLLQTARAQYFQ